ncbi:MAG TPA: HD domain-containing protein [Pyrinomonadaceae bacterium]|nr:HD domain-containing protein [Pyrinomonadaceae bacterium]
MLTDKFDEALVFASRLHAHQRRKGTRIPYISHLLAVAAIALEHGASEDEAIAALLHDAVEDQGGAQTRELICEKFGERVAEIVDACSDTDAVPKPPWHERKERYLQHLGRETRPSVFLVSASDKLHNARSLLSEYRTHGERVWERFRGGREGSLWYYRTLVEIFRRRWPCALTEELARTVDELERLASDS